MTKRYLDPVVVEEAGKHTAMCLDVIGERLTALEGKIDAHERAAHVRPPPFTFDDEDVEAAARALCEHYDAVWSATVETDRQRWRTVARTVLEAIAKRRNA